MRVSYCWNMTASPDNNRPTFRGNLMPSLLRGDRSQNTVLHSTENSGSYCPLILCLIPQGRSPRLHPLRTPQNRIYALFSLNKMCRSQSPGGLRRGSAAARLLGLRVRIPPGTSMSFFCECCVLEVFATSRSIVQRSSTDYVFVCLRVLVWSRELRHFRLPRSG